MPAAAPLPLPFSLGAASGTSVSVDLSFERTDNIAAISSLIASISPTWIEGAGLPMATVGKSPILLASGAWDSFITILAFSADSGATSSTLCAASMNPACAPTLDFPGWNSDEDSVGLVAASSLLPDDTKFTFTDNLNVEATVNAFPVAARVLTPSTISLVDHDPIGMFKFDFLDNG